MRDVAIIGAGIAGASAAFWLSRAGLDVELFEASDRLGGCMGSHRGAGFTVERGPHLFLDADGALQRLADDLGIGHELAEPEPLARRRFLFRDGALEPLPSGPGSLLTTRALSLGGKLRAAVEPLVPARGDVDESVADLIRRRFGSEVLDYLVDPFISATQLGDPEDLSTRYVMRAAGDLEREHGSVLWGGIRNRGGGDPARRTVAFTRGSWVLLEQLERALEGVLNLNSPVRELRESSRGYYVTWRHGATSRTEEFAEVVLAVPAWALADIKLKLSRAKRAGEVEASETPYAPAVLVSLGFEADAVEHSLDGFGALFPSREERKLLATIFTSSVFPCRAPEGHVLLTSILGGSRRADDLELSDAALIGRTLRELSDVFGVSSIPVFAFVERQPRALAQCDGRHHARMFALDRAISRTEGLSMICNFRGKSAVPWLVSQAAKASQGVVDRLGRQPRTRVT